MPFYSIMLIYIIRAWRANYIIHFDYIDSVRNSFRARIRAVDLRR